MRTAMALLPVPVWSTPAKGALGVVDSPVLYVRGRSAGVWPRGDGQHILRARPPSPYEAVLPEVLNSVCSMREVTSQRARV